MTAGELKDAVDALLSEPRETAIRREQSAYDEAVHPVGASVVLFGAGGLGRRTLAGLRKLRIEPLAFADNNQRLWGEKVEGVPVLSPPAAADRYGDSAAFIMTVWGAQGTDRIADRVRQLHALGCKRVVPFALLYWKHPDLFLPHYLLDLPHRTLDQADAVRATAALWDDAASRREFLAQLRFRLALDASLLSPPAEHEMYFPDDLFRFRESEAFVDCGAYDGDTIRSCLQRAPEFRGRISAFEPDPANVTRLDGYVRSLPAALAKRIEVFPCAVGPSKKRVRFDATGGLDAAMGTGTVDVDVVPLDGTVGQPVSYLKMDIEGGEAGALAGAREMLRRDEPALAICVYHRQNHLWSLAQMVRDANPRYRFFLRSHGLDGWDCVLYAAVPERLRS